MGGPPLTGPEGVVGGVSLDGERGDVGRSLEGGGVLGCQTDSSHRLLTGQEGENYDITS